VIWRGIKKESRSFRSSHFGNIFFPLLDMKMKESEEVKGEVRSCGDVLGFGCKRRMIYLPVLGI